ncbi:MAG: sialate O-acetylesterase [Lentisphaeria bacterium]|nr:sialate O-acetylesterase [Lentisphaeria bacterium]NQZ66648.1 sialate O-acetylesterase [Lentisphaeria bacterium]
MSFEITSILSDNMVLQREKPINIWGKDRVGEEITATLDGTSATTVTAEDGSWQLVLEAQNAGGPYVLKITGSETKRIENILVGEVWFCSGQSNMGMAVVSCDNQDDEINAANNPNIRHIAIPNLVAGAPKFNTGGSWQICNSETVASFSAAAYFFAKKLYAELQVPIGIIHSSWGGTPAEAWISRESLESDNELNYLVELWDKNIEESEEKILAHSETINAWAKTAIQAEANNEIIPGMPGLDVPASSPWRSSGLFNAMVAPVLNYTIRGFLWYQGESNADRACEYRNLFRTLIRDWRKNWNEELPFYFVQLAAWQKSASEPRDNAWAELQEAQTLALQEPNTGMAVISDVGEQHDIHPQNKQTVGERLALNALAQLYGQPIEYSGPVYKSHEVNGNEITIEFEHALGLHCSQQLHGFAVAAENKKFVWATAQIKSDKIILKSPIDSPVEIRYNWDTFPHSSIYNAAKLPMNLFRTDDWERITKGTRFE